MTDTGFGLAFDSGDQSGAVNAPGELGFYIVEERNIVLVPIRGIFQQLPLIRGMGVDGHAASPHCCDGDVHDDGCREGIGRLPLEHGFRWCGAVGAGEGISHIHSGRGHEILDEGLHAGRAGGPLAIDPEPP